MRNMSRIGIAAWLLVTPLAAQSVFYLPQIVDGPAAVGTVRTTILLSNTAATSNTVHVTLTRGDGSPWRLTLSGLGAGSDFSLTLKPGATRILQSDGSGDGSAGGGIVKGSARMAVAEIVSVYGADGSLLSQSASDASDTASKYVIPVDTTGVNTGVALLNPNPGAASLTFTLYDPNGVQQESVTATLAAGAQTARFVAADLFSDIGEFQGTLVVASTKPVAALTLRQESSVGAYSLLPATASTAMLLRHYLPQLADGPTATGTLQTSFLVYNLSSKPANATLALSQDSGAPWIVNIPAAGANSSFTLQLPAGGSAIWQTDGQGPATTGAAVIQSDQPIGVAAVVTALDGMGNFTGETTMSPALALQKFQAPIDATNNFNPGAAFYNPTSQNVTLTVNLLDTDGNRLSSASTVPLPPGAHMTAYLSDLFPGITGVQGAISVAVGGSVAAAVSAVPLQQNPSAAWTAGAPIAPLPITGPAINVTPALDAAHKVTATIPPKGGSLALTDAKGNKFTLTFPPNAVMASQAVTMTAVSSLAGLPAGGTFAVGVQLDPDGLVLYQPATLTIEPVAPIAPDALMPLGWHGAGQGLYLNLVDSKASKLTMQLLHFSGAGLGSGSDGYLTSQLQNIADVQDLTSSQASYWINKARSQELLGQDDSAAMERALEILEESYVDIEHLMQLGLESGDDSVLRCGALHAVEYERQRQLLGASSDGETSTLNSFLSSALTRVQQHALEKCQSTHDPLAGLDLLGFERQAQLLGLSTALGGDVISVLNQCAPNPTLIYSADANGNDKVTTGPANANLSLDAKTTANLTLTGTVPPSGLAYDGTGDGTLSYKLAGSGPLKYSAWAVSGQSSAAGVGIVCTASPGATTPSTLTVQSPKSEIKYQFTPKYNPQAPISGGNGATLAQYCPVYDKSPTEVTLALDIGSPVDNASISCVGQSTSVETDWALDAWKALHMQDGGVITSWQIPGSNSFAHKETTQTFPIDQPLTTGTATMKETMDLNQPQQ